MGSSSTSTRTSVEIARAIATSCWIASEWLPSVDAGSMSIPRSASTSVASRRIRRQSIAPKRRGSRPSTMFSATDRFGSRSISW